MEVGSVKMELDKLKEFKFLTLKKIWIAEIWLPRDIDFLKELSRKVQELYFSISSINDEVIKLDEDI